MRITLFRLCLILLLGALTVFLFLDALPYLGLATLITTLYLYWRQYAYEVQLKDEIRGVYQQGKASFEAADYWDAIATFDVVLNKYDARIWIFGEFPQTADAYLYRGTSYKRLGEADKALADYNRAIRLRPRWAQSHISKGVFYEDQNKYPEALKSHSRATQLAPNSSITHYNLGNIHLKSGSYEQAIQAFNRAIKLAPDSIEAYRGRGTARFQSGHYTEAAEDFTQVIQLALDRQNPEAVLASYDMRGTVYLYQENVRDALADFSQVVALQPSAAAYWKAAIAQKELNMNEERLASLEKALRADENFVPAYYCRGNIRHYLGDCEVALEDFRRAQGIELYFNYQTNLYVVYSFYE